MRTPNDPRLFRVALVMTFMCGLMATQGCTQVSAVANKDRYDGFKDIVNEHAARHPERAAELQGFLLDWELAGPASASVDRERYDKIVPIVHEYIGLKPDQRQTWMNALTLWRESIDRRALLPGG